MSKVVFIGIAMIVKVRRKRMIMVMRLSMTIIAKVVMIRCLDTVDRADLHALKLFKTFTHHV